MSTPSVPQSPTLLAIARQSTHLQSHLQTLLDAQSAGLVAGLGGSPVDDAASTTSSHTPSASFSASTSQFYSKPSPIVPVRQPKPKKIGLRSARRGITRAITELGGLKASEAEVLKDEIARRDNAVSETDVLARKSQDLRSEIEVIESETGNERIEGLKTTEQALGAEIHELETRLFEMKARQRHMLREISILENGVKSKLSSYRNALQLAQQEAREFLAHPPPEVVGQEKRREGVWALPPARRTLDLAREEWTDEQKFLNEKREIVLVEKHALDEGAKVWEDVIAEVGEVEEALGREMRNMGGNITGSTAEEGMGKILRRMGQAEGRLGNWLEVAEGRGWKLLVVAVGAELEAMIEGGNVLREALGAAGVLLDLDSGRRTGDLPEFTASRGSKSTNGDLIERSEDEDDGPGPDLLISREDSA